MSALHYLHTQKKMHLPRHRSIHIELTLLRHFHFNYHSRKKRQREIRKLKRQKEAERKKALATESMETQDEKGETIGNESKRGSTEGKQDGAVDDIDELDLEEPTALDLELG